MTIRYADVENPTKSLIRAGWKAQLVRTWFDQNGFTKDNMAEARRMLLRWGWVLETKCIGDTPAGKVQFQTDVLDTKREIILSFFTEELAP